MSLYGTLQVGKSALAATQAAIQTHGNNVANAGDPNHTRQVARVSSTPGHNIGGGNIIGTGVTLAGVDRQIDDSLVRRLNATIGEGAAADETLRWLEQVELAFNELGDADLSTAMSGFFNKWGELASNPADQTLRRDALAAGEEVSKRFNALSSRLAGLRHEIGGRVGTYADQADSLASGIANLNVQIMKTEGGGTLGSANALRDRRDALIGELASMVNLHAIEQDDGAINLYAGSAPIVLAGTSRGVGLDQTTDPQTGRTNYAPVFDDGAPVPARAGKLGGALSAWSKVDETLNRIDAMAAAMKFEVNKIHASGQGMRGHDSVTSELSVSDSTAALDSLDWDFPPKNGSFEIHLRDKASGQFASTLINVPLDGTAGGTSLDDLAASINAVTGVSASVVSGKLKVSSDSAAQEVTFARDTSDVLATLGIGGFFTGNGAADLTVSADLTANPLKLAAATDDTPGGSGNAAKLGALSEAKLTVLGGLTLADGYEGVVFDVATTIRSARTESDAAGAIAETLEAQRQAVSGVSLDEEAVKLLQYQRSYQGAARLIAAVDEMMQTLLQLV